MQTRQMNIKGEVHFGQSTLPIEFSQIHARPFGMEDASVALYRGEKAVGDRSGIVECREAYMFAYMLRPCPRHEEWRNGRSIQISEAPSASMTMFDMRDQWHSLLPDAFASVNIFLPHAAFDRFEGRQPNRARNALKWDHGAFVEDPVLQHLSMALMNGVVLNPNKDTLFADHVLEAMVCHVAKQYGRLEDIYSPRGKLAPWQEKRAKELMMSRLGEEIKTKELAEACGISDDHFGRMFRMTTGLPPHQWLRNQRLKMAQDFLRNSNLGLAEIALICGFSHQSHFTRVFSYHIGTSPAAWRRVSRN